MKQDNFIKMGPKYVAWTSTTTKDEVALLEVLGDQGVRKVCNYKVVVKDLLDVLLFRCHGLRKLIEPDLEDVDSGDVKLYLANNQPCCEMDGYEVTLDNKHYMVSFSLQELTKLFKINRRTSTWNNVKKSRGTILDVDTMMQVIQKVIGISIVKMSTRSGVMSKQSAVGALVTKAYIDEEEGKIHFYLDSDIADLLTPDNNYNAKYLADSFVLGSEYSKNFHSFISNFSDVFERQNWGNGRAYEYTSISTIAEAMGANFDPDIRDYDKKTGSYSRTHIVQFVKNYTKELNEKTRIPSIYGKLNYEIIRDTAKRGKVKGFRFYFEED